jgi:hypothetical protein
MSRFPDAPITQVAMSNVGNVQFEPEEEVEELGTGAVFPMPRWSRCPDFCSLSAIG